MKTIKIIICVLFFISYLDSNGTCSGTLNWTSESASDYINTHPGATGITGQTIYISTIFIDDRDFTFKDCYFAMAPNSGISLDCNHLLTIDHCQFYSCDNTNMWAGISLSATSPNPISLIIKNGSIIEDAETAIYVARDNGIEIFDSYLNKNYTAIEFDELAPNSSLQINGSNITCCSNYLYPSTTRGDVLLNPHSGSNSINGIIASGLNQLNIGDPNHGRNLFDNIEAALTVNYSNVAIKNNEFDYCGHHLLTPIASIYYGAPLNPLPLYNLVIGGTNSNEKNYFYSAVNGVSNLDGGYNISIYSNDFNYVDNPIHILTSSNKYYLGLSLNINNNNILNFSIGIKLESCSRIRPVGYISNNVFGDIYSSVSKVGIWCSNYAASENLIIQSNYIYNCQSPIKVNYYQSNFEILDNRIFIYDNQTSFTGIILVNCYKSRVLDNVIWDYRSNPANNSRIEGIQGSYLTACTIRHNYANGNNHNYKGIHLIGTNLSTQMECNYLTNCPEAIYLGTPLSGGGVQPATISPQGNSLKSSGNQFSPLTNQYYRINGDISTATRWYFYGTSNVSNSEFPYRLFNNLVYSSGSSSEDCIIFPFANPHADYDDIISGTLHFENDSSQFMYNCNSKVFQIFLYNPELKDTTRDFLDWFNHYYDSNFGKLERIEYLINEVDSAPDSLDLARSYLKEIDPENQIEVNKVFYLDLLLNKLFVGDFANEDDSIRLNSIACQNSILGGEAVLWARSFLESDYNDESNCDSRLSGNHFNNRVTSNSEIGLFPNPSNGTISFKGDNSKYQFEIFDIIGKSIKTIPEVSDGYFVNLNLPQGYYFFQLKPLNGNKTITGKLSIIK